MVRSVLAACCVLALLAPVWCRSSLAESQNGSWKERRMRMVSKQVEARGIRDQDVLRALRTVPREEFVPEKYREEADSDSPLPIGYRQTISQPYIVALMTEMLQVERHHRVLEIGTGSGYQAAILGTLSDSVYSVEIIAPLAERASQTLKRLGYEKIQINRTDGNAGWPEHAPYDRILLTAAPTQLPQALVEQLAPGGRLVAPVGSVNGIQQLILVTKAKAGRVHTETGVGVRFVPLVKPVPDQPSSH